MRQRLRQSVCLTLCVASLAWAQPGQTDTPAPPDLQAGEIGIECLLSTGETLAGVVQADKADRLLLRDANGRRHAILKNNLVHFRLSFDADATKALAATPAEQRRMAIGRRLLDAKLDGLALPVFRRAAHDLPGLAEFVAFYGPQPPDEGGDAEILKALAKHYRETSTPQPVVLGGDAPDSPPLPAARNYTCPTPDVIEANVAIAEAWAEAARKIAPTMHGIETDHFIIYSAWSKGNDKALSQIYERLYDTLCKQFNIPPDENIWAGKLPVYVFWEKKDYVTFAMEVCKVGPEMATKTAGFAGWRGHFRFVVLGPVQEDGVSKRQAQRRFYEILTHESTHAFLGRFINDRPIISWVNEGIAETMSNALVPQSSAAYKLKLAHKQFRGGPPGQLAAMLRADHIPLDPAYYGASQSVVRFLINADRKKFIRFVELIKAGKSDEDALKESFGWDHRQLLALWVRSLGR